MKNILLITIVAIASVMSMTSCSSESDFDDLNQETVESSSVTRSGNENISKDSACVRIKMYETISGYDVVLSNVKIQNMAGSLPSFGNNFEGTTLGDKVYAPTYDTANGSFAYTKAGTQIQLAMSFDAKLIAEDGGDVISIKGISTTLNEKAIVLNSGVANEITVKVNASMLNLQAVSFNASVQDTQNQTYKD